VTDSVAPGDAARPWDAEIEVDTERARGLIRDRFPGIPATSIEPLGRGWDNTAFVVDRAIVFRFPRKPETARLLETEASALPVIGPLVPLAIPRPEWIAGPGDDFPWPFVGHRLVPGRTACGAHLSDEDRHRAAPLLGAFLARLHAIPATAVDVPGDTIARTDFALRRKLIMERLDVLRSNGLIDDPSRWLRLFHSFDAPAPAPTATLVHGDLYVRHLIVDEANSLPGVIDWGDVHAGDAAVDIMLLFGFLPASARDGFLRAYGDVDERTLRVAKLRATFHAITIGWSGIEQNDRDLVREAIAALRFVIQ
jgi:aminoglycoside phosphotransferase (APT) family kinase protein